MMEKKVLIISLHDEEYYKDKEYYKSMRYYKEVVKLK